MNFQHSMSCGGLVILLLWTGMVGCSLGERFAPPVGTTTPVTTARLKDARLQFIRSDLNWRFPGQQLLIENGGEPLPPDLVEELTGQKATLQQMEATWALNPTADRLQLSDVRLDGEKLDRELTISIEAAGHVRVNLGSRQYNLFPGEAQNR